MEKWFRNQCDIYNNYRTHSFHVPPSIKSLFKNRETESENIMNHLSENNNTQLTKTTIKKIGVRECSRNTHWVDENGNVTKRSNLSRSFIMDNQIWRRLSLQSYKKRKQEKQEQRTKPMLPPVLRTYDKRGLQKPTTDWL